MTKIAEKISLDPPTARWATFQRDGSVISGTDDDVNRIAYKVGKNYYEDSLNLLEPKKGMGGIGYCAQVAGFEGVTALALLLAQRGRGAALWSNAATTALELGQVVAASKMTDINEKYGEDFTGKVSSSLVALSGGVSLFFGVKEAKEVFYGNAAEEVENPWWMKSLLSLGSLISSALMFVNWGEKATVGAVINSAKDEKLQNDLDPKAVRVDSNNDFRCFAEWLIMGAYPWFGEKLKGVKAAADVILPAMSLQDGVFELFDWKKPRPVPKLFTSEWYLGKQGNGKGFREKVFGGLLENLYGIKMPRIRLNSSGEISVKVPEFVESEEQAFIDSVSEAGSAEAEQEDSTKKKTPGSSGEAGQKPEVGSNEPAPALS